MTEPVRPSVIIRELLTKADISMPEAAMKLRVSPAYLYNLLRGITNARLSHKMISKLAALFDSTDEEYWRKLSDDYYEYKIEVNNARY